MAKPIGVTPSLKGQDAKDFLKEMEKPPSKSDKEYKKKLDSLKRIVPF